MTVAWRVLLWIVVVIAPGGVLLLPLLAADALRRRAASSSISQPVSSPSERGSRFELSLPQVG